MSTLPAETSPPRDAPSPEPAREPSALLRALERVPTGGWLAIVLVLGAIVHSPSLSTGPMLDDYLHSSMIQGTFPVERHPLDLYNFVDDANRQVLFERGLIPWWSHPELTIRFFRPLSCVLLWADHLLFGDGSVARHAHSYLWWALAVLAARMLFSRVLSPRAAWIATFAYALAPCHAMPLAWVANREALVSLAFGTTGLVLQLRARQERSVKHAIVASFFFACALFAGEYGIAFGAYVLALELVRRGEPLGKRALGMMPFALPAAIYLGIRTHLGYGSYGSGFYVDPLHDPLPFFVLAPRRIATLLAQGWLSLDPTTITWSIPSWALLLGVALAGVVVVSLFRASTAHLDEEARRGALFLALGSCFAVAPVLAVVPSPRLLGASVLGVAATVAVILEAAWLRAPSALPLTKRRTEAFALVALGLGFSQLVHGPVTAWLEGRHFRETSATFAGQMVSLRQLAGDAATADVVVVRGMAATPFAPFAMYEDGQLPARIRLLSQTGHVLLLRRGPRTFDLVVAHERGVFPGGEANLYLAGREIHQGDVFEAPGVRVTVLEVEAGLPRIARYDFDEDLDDPGIAWVNETSKAYFDGTPPEEGFGRPYDHGR